MSIRFRSLSRWAMPVALVLALVLSSAGSANGRSSEPRNPVDHIPLAELGLFFHVGYGVADLDAAKARFSRSLGLTWQPVLVFTQPVRLEHGEVRQITFHIAFSDQGPPYIELVHVIDGEGDNPWTATRRSSPAHFGYAVTDVAAASDALVAAGFRRIATVDVPGQSAAGFAYHRGPGEITVEVLDIAFAPPGVCATPGSPFCPAGP